MIEEPKFVFILPLRSKTILNLFWMEEQKGPFRQFFAL